MHTNTTKHKKKSTKPNKTSNTRGNPTIEYWQAFLASMILPACLMVFI